ncbi:40S ribosomal protein S6 [Durusdinium trenchii]|uniref:40S ribosomal protein S6 n=1 Tax=Durusdinium trenchii TaxID=1381693 RepID=A0ABP0S2E3_9DINO
MDGVSMPIGVWDLYWDSGLIFARIFQILASEKLGYNVEILGGSSNSNSVVFRLAGCNESDVLSASCFSAPRRFHFSFESWGNYQQYVPTLLKELGDRGPVNLGGVGYPGTEGLHVLGGAINRALSDRGLSLLYYRNYNADWFRVNDYTARVSDVNLSRLGTCDDGVNTGYGFFASDYLAATGDTEGVYTTTEGESGEMWIQVQGASSRQLCECREGAHMVSGLCVQCPEGQTLLALTS